MKERYDLLAHPGVKLAVDTLVLSNTSDLLYRLAGEHTTQAERTAAIDEGGVLRALYEEADFDLKGFAHYLADSTPFEEWSWEVSATVTDNLVSSSNLTVSAQIEGEPSVPMTYGLTGSGFGWVASLPASTSQWVEYSYPEPRTI